MKTFKLSPSALKLMEECPRCFWLTYNQIWKRPFGIFPTLPSGMDRILKNHFDNFMMKGEMPPELCRCPDCKDLKLFDDIVTLNNWRDGRIGISHVDGAGNILMGAVDNILRSGDKLVVLDYKTRGYAVKDNTAEFSRTQLEVYNFILRKMGHATEDFAFLLFYVPREVGINGEVIFDTTLVKVNIDVDRAERVWKEALDLLNGECPGKRCEWCRKI